MEALKLGPQVSNGAGPGAPGFMASHPSAKNAEGWGTLVFGGPVPGNAEIVRWESQDDQRYSIDGGTLPRLDGRVARPDMGLKF
jgi:hypothetical protein